MRFNRTFKLHTVILAVCLMLFAQITVAAYACPGMVSSSASGAQQPGVHAIAATMNHCEQMLAEAGVKSRSDNKAQPALCAEHCHPTQQSTHAQLPTLPAMLLISLYTVPTVADLPAPSWPTQAAQGSHLEAEPPPLSILHCCFRL